MERLFLFNESQMVWLPPLPPGAPDSASGERLPPWVTGYICFPKDVRIFSRRTGGMMLIFPERPLDTLPEPLPQPLSAGDLRLLALVRRGATYQQAAARLGKSQRWVRYHLSRIYQEHGPSAWPGRYAPRRKQKREQEN